MFFSKYPSIAASITYTSTIDAIATTPADPTTTAPASASSMNSVADNAAAMIAAAGADVSGGYNSQSTPQLDETYCVGSGDDNDEGGGGGGGDDDSELIRAPIYNNRSNYITGGNTLERENGWELIYHGERTW
ncbi:uncharacterized protein LAJ45_08044 [Morchella importuna]|uniref:uncharacterized protein n=1 Tax=Morchella importuna TaxID=1174673 RepID=UPI001E8D146C|nr:uncharacterized protein LAJ45_08044 [Morchella importuna]KAH8147943.1 hypothetical protein LAJ45_08044 [Morchella importuna]